LHGATDLVGHGVLIEALGSHSFRHTELGPSRLDGRSLRHRDVYLTTHTTFTRN